MGGRPEGVAEHDPRPFLGPLWGAREARKRSPGCLSRWPERFVSFGAMLSVIVVSQLFREMLVRRLLTLLGVVLFLGGVTACGESECDKLESCCEALGGGADCSVPSDADDSECKDARAAVAALAELAGDAPSECK